MEKTLSLTEKTGTPLGAILLICGSAIGVGILPLPILTGYAGTLPTLAMSALCWLFMSITALLLLEVSLVFSGKKNFISLAKETLNPLGQTAVFFSFIFLFYSLTTAYLAKGGELVYTLYQKYSYLPLPQWAGAASLALLSGGLIFLGPYIVDQMNRLFMAGFFLTYFFLAFAGNSYFHTENISHSDWSYSLFILPFLVTSFGYHNIVPSINDYLKGDRKKLLLAISSAGLILFVLYNLWIVLFQGIIPLHGPISIDVSFAQGEIVTEPLSRLVRIPLICLSAQYMAFFAIITSLLGQGLSIIDFLADSLQLKKGPLMRLALCLALFLPTLLCSQLIPGIFFKALEWAGGIAAMVLFGIIPALMSWVIRYRRKDLSIQPLVPGGKPLLLLILTAASLLIGYELCKNFSLI